MVTIGTQFMLCGRMATLIDMWIDLDTASVKVKVEFQSGKRWTLLASDIAWLAEQVDNTLVT